MHVYRSIVLNADIATVWAAVRGFDGVVNWNPGVIAARLEHGSPTEVGAVRALDITDGSTFRETLLEHSDRAHFYTYDIIESPLPVTNYVSTHRFVPITHSNETLGVWECSFDCPPDNAEEMIKVVGDAIYIAGMQGLNTYLSEAKG